MKKKRELQIGDYVKETSFVRAGRRRVGEIVSIRTDSKSDPIIECIELCPKELIPLEMGFGQMKNFTSKRSKLKHYIPRKSIFIKETFEIGKYVSCKSGNNLKYGRISAYRNQEEGLYPNSYNKGEYNGHDLLECIEINPKAGLHRVVSDDGSPKIFIGYPERCKLVKVIDTDQNGKPNLSPKLDIS
jgi:hypothetical protein